MGEIRWFRTDVIYAAPVPDAPFRAVTNAVVDEWPDFLPCGGEHGEPTPHLTIGDDGTAAALTRAAAAIARHLPLACSAREVWLMTGNAEVGWDRKGIYPRGGL